MQTDKKDGAAWHRTFVPARAVNIVANFDYKLREPMFCFLAFPKDSGFDQE